MYSVIRYDDVISNTYINNMIIKFTCWYGIQQSIESANCAINYRRKLSYLMKLKLLIFSNVISLWWLLVFVIITSFTTWIFSYSVYSCFSHLILNEHFSRHINHINLGKEVFCHARSLLTSITQLAPWQLSLIQVHNGVGGVHMGWPLPCLNYHMTHKDIFAFAIICPHW